MRLSLRARFLVLFGALFLLGGAAGYRFFVWYGEDVQTALGLRLAERNALYGKSQILAVLSRDVLLVQHLAGSARLRSWIANESDAGLRATAIAELEELRPLLRGRSYFLAVARSGNYYYGDDAFDQAARPRYQLAEANRKDGWFYATLGGARDLQLNVDTDRHLGLTQVWINAVVRDGDGRPVAVAGTGVGLGDVIRTVVEGREEGVTNLLLDQDGAIQAHQDVSMIDFASARKAATAETRSTIFPLLDTERDRGRLKAAMARLAEGHPVVAALPLSIQGREQLAGLAWVPEIRWFVVTLANPRAIGGAANLPGLLTALVLALVVVLFGAAVVLQRTVLRRLSRLDASVNALSAGHYDVRPEDASGDEIGRLARAFGALAARVASHTEDLERQVAERTAALENLAHTDFLTGCLNRRGMIARLEVEWARHAREGGRVGVLLIDIDRFKAVNDNLGHAAGDAVLAALAGVLRGATRPYDALSRWGGEEFLVGVFGLGGREELEAIAAKLLVAVRAAAFAYQGTPIPVTVSIGAKLADLAQDLDRALHDADEALYEAKAAGRDRLVTAR